MKKSKYDLKQMKDNFVQAGKELVGVETETESRQPGGTDMAGSGASSFSFAQPRNESHAGYAYAGESERYGGYAASPSSPDIISQPTVIARKTVIEGSIRSEGDIDLRGDVKGNLTGRRLSLSGSLVGNAVVKGAELTRSGRMEGNLEAESLLVDGELKGDIAVEHGLQIQRDALVKGKIIANRLSVEEGAILDGEIKIGGGRREERKNIVPEAAEGMNDAVTTEDAESNRKEEPTFE